MDIIISKHDPLITPLTVNWQLDKSSQLELTFCEQIEQPTSYSGLHLNSICCVHTWIWGTEMEILAASAILETDIYVATECDLVDNSSPFQMSRRVIRWCRYSACSNYDHSCAIYMANFNNHYEPVEKFINSNYPTYAEEDQNVISLD